MLKKAGIVVAAAAAGVLAVSPLAFAGEKGDDGGHRHHSSHAKNDDHSTTYDHSPKCTSGPNVADNSVGQSAGVTAPVVALLGLAGNLAVPVNAQVQGPILSCNNLEDIANVDVHDVLQNGSRNRF